MRRIAAPFLLVLLTLPVSVARAKLPDPAFKVVTLFATEDDFRGRWLKGSGTVAFDARSKAVHVNADVNYGGQIGGFCYRAPWSELVFKIAVGKPSIGEFVPLFCDINGQEFDLTKIIGEPGTFTLHAVLGSGKTASLMVDGIVAGEATLKSDADLQLRFRSRSELGGNVHIFDARIVGAPEPVQPHTAPDKINSAAFKSIPLLQTQADVDKHWKKGGGSVDFDAKSKILAIEKTDPWDLGSLHYNGRSEQLDFDFAIDKQRTKQPHHCYLSFGRPGSERVAERFDLTPVVPAGGEYHISAAYVRGKTLGVFVNGKAVQRLAFVLDDTMLTPLNLQIQVSLEGTFHIGNVKIKVQDIK